jgi:hypothetical protein
VKRRLKQAAIALAAFLVLLSVYGAAVESRFILDERRYQAPLSGLGPAWAGTEVAVISDLQVGMWWANTAMVERVCWAVTSGATLRGCAGTRQVSSRSAAACWA